MATVKVNSRSPYYVVASGADGGKIENASVKIVQVTGTGDKDGPISEIYGTNIREGHIFMCSRDFEYQQFDLTPANYDEWRHEWYERLYAYYQKQAAA